MRWRIFLALPYALLHTPLMPIDPLSVACPACLAVPGVPCKGTRVPSLVQPHPKRHRRAVERKPCDDCGKPTGWHCTVGRCRECPGAASKRTARAALKRRRDLGIDRDKDRARRITKDAIRRGVLVRPKRCQECGDTPRPGEVIHAHHPDYSKPLAVEWLCQWPCHASRHRGQPRRRFVAARAAQESA